MEKSFYSVKLNDLENINQILEHKDVLVNEYFYYSDLLLEGKLTPYKEEVHKFYKYVSNFAREVSFESNFGNKYNYHPMVTKDLKQCKDTLLIAKGSIADLLLL